MEAMAFATCAGALHWVAKPYVHELRYTAATGQLDVRTATLFGSPR